MAETRTARRRREAAEAKARERGGSSFDLAERAGSIGDAARSHPGIIITLVAVILAVVMLYAPTRNYYVAWRSSQDLQARRRGLIKEDETSVVVEGLPEDELSDLFAEIELEDTRPWYIKVLDVVFFYSTDSWQ